MNATELIRPNPPRIQTKKELTRQVEQVMVVVDHLCERLQKLDGGMMVTVAKSDGGKFHVDSIIVPVDRNS